MAEQTNWQYKPEMSEGGQSPDPAPSNANETVTWEASEYIDHSQGASWFMMLFLVMAVLAGLVYLLTKDYIAVATVVIVGVIVAVAAARKPKQIIYEVSPTGLRIGEKSYGYKTFRSFSIVQDKGLNSISLLPIKRFMPSLFIYYEPADEEKIVDILGEHMPFEEHKIDAVDRLTRRLRF